MILVKLVKEQSTSKNLYRPTNHIRHFSVLHALQDLYSVIHSFFHTFQEHKYFEVHYIYMQRLTESLCSVFCG